MVCQSRRALQGNGNQRGFETLTTHEFRSKTLAKAFTEITGIKVKHDVIQEGDVVEKIQTQMQSGKNVYDGWINDSDFIGTHFRYGQAVDLTDWMAKEGKDVTDPMLDVDDFIGKSFTTAPNGHLYQLPDQQFANLYWFRYDWFTNPDIKAKFKAKYGYDLGVPVNWSAYEDIAEFFTNDIKEINGVKVYGHMDYGKKDRHSAGGSPTRGCRWPAAATRAFRTGCRSTNGASAWKAAVRSARRSNAVATSTARPRSIRS